MNNQIQQWAIKYGIPPLAYHELVRILKEPSGPISLTKQPEQSEAAVQQKVTLSWSQMGGILWRNNVGVASDMSGRPVRYGLANLSKRMNEQVKSSDLIGVTPVLVTADMVGRVVGVFTAPECKHGGWRWGEDKRREVPQNAYHEIVRSLGGIAGFVASESDMTTLYSNWYSGVAS